MLSSKIGKVLSIEILGALFVLLFFLLMPYTLPLERPAWWYRALGETWFTAIAWAQLAHSLSIVLAGILPAICIVLYYPKNKFRSALVVSTFLSIIHIFDITNGYLRFSSAFSSVHLMSSTIDVLKPYAIMIFEVYLLSFILCIFYTENKSTQNDDLINT